MPQDPVNNVFPFDIILGRGIGGNSAIVLNSVDIAHPT